MTDQDVTKMFFMVKAAYPRMFKDYDEVMTSNYIDAWYMVFKDVPAEQGFKGLKVYMSTETTGFPPSPGQIMECIHYLTPDDLPNEMEAWALVDKAVKNSTYNSQEEFEKLPQIVKRAVRNPARLKEWAKMDISEYQTVEQSNFMRTYRAEVEKARMNEKIPQDIRPRLEQISSPLPQIEEHKEVTRAVTPDAAINAMIEKLKN